MARSATKLKIVETPVEKPKKALLKLDLGCGDNVREGFLGVDFVKTPSVKYVHDLFTFPWPFKESSVEEAHLSHFFEHVPAKTRPRFMDELFRVLAPDGKVTVITPYFNSVRATQDYTHEWPPISPNSFLYFNRKWREDNKLTHGHYQMKCDFDFQYGYALQGVWPSKSEETRNFAILHYCEVISDLHTTLTSRKGKVSP
jgi:predicted SAM-dependent methyltransferase